ncbi:hypothetical protein [Cognatiluteimonas profundi]|uniref:hypothetical protein n=1 Tax=Cognatiluteimonas profundi TaxID=2594501 RepID=UPI00131C2083|nr:hypothetical protein [Lysobacter profundi]
MPVFHQSTRAPDPRLEHLLRRSVLVAGVLVLCVPLARGDSVWFGSIPLWLLGMPLVSWWSLHRFRLPRPPRAATGMSRRRGRTVQARRYGGNREAGRLARAA